MSEVDLNKSEENITEENAEGVKEGESAEASAEENKQKPEIVIEDPEEDEAEQEDAQAASDHDENETEEAERTSMFGRKKKEIEKYRQQVEELTDKLKRNMAEFDNFRKRTEKEKSGMYIIGARDIVEKILPVVDSFERGLSQAPENDAFADGMKLVYKQLMTALEDMGVAPIEAVGKDFDPSFHNAVMHVDDENYGENTVVEEFQKGYTYKDSVVRHSMVKVAN